MRVGKYRTKFIQLPAAVRNLVPLDGSGTTEQQYTNLFPLSGGFVTVITRADNHGRLKRLYEPFNLETGTDKDLQGRQYCIIIGKEWDPKPFPKLTPENTSRITIEIHNNQLKTISVQDFNVMEDAVPASLFPDELNQSIREFNFVTADRQTRTDTMNSNILNPLAKPAETEQSGSRVPRTKSLERPIRSQQIPKRKATSLEREHHPNNANGINLEPPVFPQLVRRDNHHPNNANEINLEPPVFPQLVPRDNDAENKTETNEIEDQLRQQIVDRDEQLAISLLAEEEHRTSNARMERELRNATIKAGRDEQTLKELRTEMVQVKREREKAEQEHLEVTQKNQDLMRQMLQIQQETEKLKREMNNIKKEPQPIQYTDKQKGELERTNVVHQSKTYEQKLPTQQTTMRKEPAGKTKPIGISNKIQFPIYDRMRDDIEDIVDRFEKVLELFGGNDEDTRASLTYMFLQRNNMEELATYNPEILHSFETLKEELVDRYQDQGNSDEIFVTTTIKNSEDERDFGDRLARIFRRWMKMDPTQPLTEGEEKTLKARYISALKDGKVRLRLRLEAENLSYQELAIRARQIRQAFQREEDGNGLVNTVMFLKQKVSELGERVPEKQRCDICRLPHPTEHCQASQKVVRKHNKKTEPPRSVEFAIPEDKLTPGVKPNEMLPTAEPTWHYNNYDNNYYQRGYGQRQWRYNQYRPRYQQNRGSWRPNAGRWSNGWPNNYANNFKPRKSNQMKDTTSDEQIHNSSTLAARVEDMGENVFL